MGDHAEGGCNSTSYFVMVDGLLRVALEAVYITKNAVTQASLELLAHLREKTNRTRGDFFCGIELLVFGQQPSEVDQRLCLFYRTPELFKGF